MRDSFSAANISAWLWTGFWNPLGADCLNSDCDGVLVFSAGGNVGDVTNRFGFFQAKSDQLCQVRLNRSERGFDLYVEYVSLIQEREIVSQSK